MLGPIDNTEVSTIKRFSWSLHSMGKGGGKEISVPKLSKMIAYLCNIYEEKCDVSSNWKMVHYRGGQKITLKRSCVA